MKWRQDRDLIFVEAGREALRAERANQFPVPVDPSSPKQISTLLVIL
jgi:hypothetical protein